jgi:predicted exporter
MSASFRWRSPWLARVVVALAAVLAAGWLLQLDLEQKITTDVTALLPADEQAPELNLLRAWVGQAQGRTLWLVLEAPGDATPSETATAAFASVLQTHPAIAAVELLDPTATRDGLGRFLFERRFEYFLAPWLAERWDLYQASDYPRTPFPAWLAQSVVAELDRFLATPESAAFDELLPADPLLLLPSMLAPLLPEGGEGPPPAAALLWAQSTAPPLSREGQAPVQAAFDAALAEARQHQADLQLRWTGVHRFAAASQARIHAEFVWLNGLAVVVVLLTTTSLVRRPWRVLHLAPVVLLSLLGAWAATTVIFAQVHIFVFVLGALLTGAAIDYGFHVAVAATHGPATGRRRPLRQVIKPLLTSCLTTIIGFSLLWFSDLPLLRQLGVFVSAGLLSALFVSLLYLPSLADAVLQPRWQQVAPRLPIRRRWLLLALSLLVVPGLIQVRWHDDIRELEVPTPELAQNDASIRAWFGEHPNRSAYLVRGQSLEEAREHLHQLRVWHDHQFPQHALRSLAFLWPPRHDYEQLPDLVTAARGFGASLAAELEGAGYEVATFHPFLSAWEQFVQAEPRRHQDLVTDLHRQLPGPLRQGWGEAEGQAWILAFADHARADGPPEGVPAIELNQLRTLNRMFTRYRVDALRLASVGLLLVAASVFLLYGWRQGSRVFALPIGAGLITFGLLGWMDEPLNVFHLLGGFLGLCLSHDYAIFAASQRRDADAAPASVRLAALTTASSFGVLIFSRIPVISALGLTVTLMVLCSLAMVELWPRPVRP